jgi:hypothetical protein
MATETEEAIQDVLDIELARVVEEEMVEFEEKTYREELEQKVIDQQKQLVAKEDEALFLRELIERDQKEYPKRPIAIAYRDTELTSEDIKIISAYASRGLKFVIAFLCALILLLSVLLVHSYFGKKYQVVVFAQAIQQCSQELEAAETLNEEAVDAIHYFAKSFDGLNNKIEALSE